MATISQKYKFQPKTSYEKAAFDVVKKLKAKNFEAYFVGGFARDIILKRKRTDIDIATSATPLQAKNVLNKYKIISRDEKFGTLRLVTTAGVIELTTFRKESTYEKRRRPKAVSFIEQAEIDARRRDFTMNALFYDPVQQTMLDFVGGIADVAKRVIRCVGKPEKRFTEDALRMLRAFRFVSQLGFKIEKKTLFALEHSAPHILDIAKERVRLELEKLMLGAYPARSLRAMHNAHLLKYILPEIFILSSIPQNPKYHLEGDVFTHTLLALEHIKVEANLPLRFAVLFHDVGKAQTTKEIMEDGKRKIVSYGHEVVGANMIPRIMGVSGLRFDNKTIAKVQWLVRNHMVMYQLHHMRMAKQMAYATHKWFPDLLELDRVDDLGRMTKDRNPLKPYRYGKRILLKARKATNNQSLEVFLQKIITGNDVKKILNIDSGPKVGNILQEVRQLFFQGKIHTRKQAIALVKSKQALPKQP